MQGTKSVQVHWLCSSFRILSTHSGNVWVHLRNWFSLTKANTAYLHAFVSRIWGSYSNDPSLPCKSVPWPDFFHWFHWFSPIELTHMLLELFSLLRPRRSSSDFVLSPPCRRWDSRTTLSVVLSAKTLPFTFPVCPLAENYKNWFDSLSPPALAV